ncbi:alpha/beta fold hydrolase [Streptomyces sp. NBC_01795]|uniref:alpha/beta fold hydrolase n=1 Tax=unclassified Streptomyces TaxID=2593676 RepID=UPI002DDA0BA6|nr:MULTISPECIES: alpha/beta fold hydrolase [unclassified Streptomyces]WSA96759.1 alpha/beta fold hydrolase [Streptomyces sp. NBC_01795]WSB81175.1 alpha/beta fold hydrolase [Streptomyces sp. NBC_01775]WSS10616.1 alpha/beta fold hydrolase [Streptomyces sp. NBC_01186]
MPTVFTPQTPASVSTSVVRVRPPARPAFDVAYERRGSGEPVLLLHGIGHHWQAWEPVLTVLTARYDVIAVDLPGFGASPALPEGVSYGVESIVPLLAETCAALGVERPHVVGNSLGGLLALEMGLHGHARSVTALSPAGFWNGAERRYAFGVLQGMRVGARALPSPVVGLLARSAAGRAALTSTIYARPGRRSPDAVVAETRALARATGFTPVLAEGQRPGSTFREDITDVPVTIGWGDRDRILLRRQGVRAKRVIPGARLVRLRGCGHVPMNDDPAAVARIVLDTARLGSL